MAAAHRRDRGPERQRLCRFRRPDGREEVREELTGNAAAPCSVPRPLTWHDARRKTTSTVSRHNRPISARFQGVSKDSVYPTFCPAAQAGNRIGPPTLPRPLCRALLPEEKIPNWKRYSLSATTSL